MPSHAPPNVRLQLRSQPENISLIRTTLTGVAEAIELPRETLDDITTAVTEAANNVVLHAYRGDSGPLEIDIHIAESLIEVVVRDEGAGLPRAPDHGSLKAGETGELGLELGLAVIQALTSEVGFHSRSSGGTEVRMEFATPPETLSLDAIAHDELESPLFDAGALTAATIAITPARLARAVLPRLVCALAARASFSTDRLSDAQLLADLIAAQAFQAITGSHLGVGIAAAPRFLELRVGPLPAGQAGSVSSVLGELAPVIGRLSDDHSFEPAGRTAVLALQLLDPR
ncbi:MAG TPA: ATP-binding protein [Solirubrobacteraceae bacterium]|jgi:serine/threonine-protein kinase RsbW